MYWCWIINTNLNSHMIQIFVQVNLINLIQMIFKRVIRYDEIAQHETLSTNQLYFHLQVNTSFCEKASRTIFSHCKLVLVKLIAYDSANCCTWRFELQLVCILRQRVRHAKDGQHSLDANIDCRTPHCRCRWIVLI